MHSKTATQKCRPKRGNQRLQDNEMKTCRTARSSNREKTASQSSKTKLNIAQDSGTGSRQMSQRLASDTLDWSKLKFCGKQMAHKPVDFIICQGLKKFPGLTADN